MCVIIHSPNRKQRPSLDTLRACDSANPHGIGLAWREGGMVRYLKGLTPKSIHENLDILKGEIVIHFRYATVGGKRPVLCHPFPITEAATPREYGSAQTVLFHNGHWSGWEAFKDDYCPYLDGPISDSRLIAIGIYLAGTEFLEDIHGRFLLFSHADATQRFGDWHERTDGCHYSNLNWIRRREPTPRASKELLRLQSILPVHKRQRGQHNDPGEAMACFAD